MKVKQLMTPKVVTVPPEMPLKEVATLLVRNRISGAPVCDAEGHVVGVVSEADILWKELGLPPEHHRAYGLVLDLAYGDGQRNAARTAEEAINAPAITVSRNALVSTAAKLMVTNAVNRLPIVEDGTSSSASSRAPTSSVCSPVATLRLSRRSGTMCSSRLSGSILPPCRSASSTERLRSPARWRTGRRRSWWRRTSGACRASWRFARSFAGVSTTDGGGWPRPAPATVRRITDTVDEESHVPVWTVGRAR